MYTIVDGKVKLCKECKDYLFEIARRIDLGHFDTEAFHTLAGEFATHQRTPHLRHSDT